MAVLYRSGKSLEEIGVQFGVSRERVRQILSKITGHSKAGGGMAVMTIMRERERTGPKAISEKLGVSCGTAAVSLNQAKHILGLL